MGLEDSRATEGVVARGGLLTGDGNARDMGAVIDAGELGKGAPAATDVEKRLPFLQSELLTDDGHLVVLHLLERLLACGVGGDAARVDHAGFKEPRGLIVATVEVGSDLLLVLLARVEEHVPGEGEEDGMKDLPLESKSGPIMAMLHNVANIAVEINVTVEANLVKRLHWDLVVAAPSLAVFGVLESDVVLDGAAGKLKFVVDAR